MNTDIHFKISAPTSLSIFGEHAKNRLRTSIDLRTTVNFKITPASLPNDIEINFPQMNLLYKISLQEFIKFYNYCVEKKELLNERMLQNTYQCESINQKIFLQIFYYLLVRITYEEQIEIKSFSILLTTQLTSNGELMSLASLKVCLVACLLHWSHLQKGVHSTFDDNDLKKILFYAILCGTIAPKSDFTDLMVCTYGSTMKYERERDRYEGFCLPSTTILLVDSNRTQYVEAQKRRVAELMNMFPELANSILNIIDTVTNTANNVLKKIYDIYKDDELSIEMKNDRLLQQYKALETCTHINHGLLQTLGVSCIQLDKICAIAQKHGLSGKYTDLDNGRYAYIWCPYTIDITILMDELKTHGFDVMQTNLFGTGVKIE